MTKTATSLKKFAARHRLHLMKDVPAEESSVTAQSLLVHAGAIDRYLAQGAVNSHDTVVAFRRYHLKAEAHTNQEVFDLFVIAINYSPPQDQFLAVNTSNLPPAFNSLLKHNYILQDSLEGSGQHSIYAHGRLDNAQLVEAQRLASTLAESVNLEVTASQIILFTAAEIDKSDLVEHLYRTTVQVLEDL